jgi:hypothetical protein
MRNLTDGEARWIPAVALIVAVLALVWTAVYLVYYCTSCSPELRLALLAGYGTLILLFFLGLIVLVEIASGRIPLTNLLSETGPNGKLEAASLSRFQLLMFTFVIALSLFLVTVINKGFPAHIPPELLTLLGISASTYAVSKGIQASAGGAPNGQGGAADQTTSTTQDPATGKITTTEQNRSTGQTRITVHDPATGQTTTTLHNPTTVTTTTTLNPPPPAPGHAG